MPCVRQNTPFHYQKEITTFHIKTSPKNHLGTNSFKITARKNSRFVSFCAQKRGLLNLENCFRKKCNCKRPRRACANHLWLNVPFHSHSHSDVFPWRPMHFPLRSSIWRKQLNQLIQGGNSKKILPLRSTGLVCRSRQLHRISLFNERGLDKWYDNNLHLIAGW